LLLVFVFFFFKHCCLCNAAKLTENVVWNPMTWFVSITTDVMKVAWWGKVQSFP